MFQHLRSEGFPVRGVNVGGTPRDRERYFNLKAELFWGFRQRAESGDLAGLQDDKAIAQLAGIRYEINARGQIAIESKPQARKRNVTSPDRAEAIILAFADVKKAGSNLLEWMEMQIEKQGMED
jgi:hypothetical protein